MRIVCRFASPHLLSLALLLAGCVTREDHVGDRSIGTESGAAVAEAPAVATAPASPKTPRASVAAAPSEAAAVPADSEQITVVGRSFTGLWTINSPKRLGMDVGLFSGVNVRYSGETGDRDLCELRQSGDRLDAHCLRLSHDVAGRIDGDRITLMSWMGPANVILSAQALSGSRLTGSLSGGAMGQRLTSGVPIEATKLDPPADGIERPSAPLVRDVLGDIGGGHLTAGRYAPEAAARLGHELRDLQAEQAALGPLKGLTYLAPLLPRHPFDPRERPLEVYRVEYAGGTQLCGISPGEGGRVDDFLCR